jgi:hypothetical protein
MVEKEQWIPGPSRHQNQRWQRAEGSFLAAEDAMKNQVDILKQSKVNLYLFAE